MRAIPMFNSHKIELVDVREKNGNTAIVDIYLQWQNQLDGQPFNSMLMRNTMTVVESNDGNFKVTGYLPRVLKN